MSVNVRAAVGKALIRAEKEPEKAVRILDGVLDPIRDPRDRAFAARLFYTVLQNEKWLDWQLQRRCRTPLKELQPAVRNILRVCAAQLLYFDRIPAYSAVNEAVAECRKQAPRAAGLVNAVCRRIADEGEADAPEGTSAERLAVRYSHPLWFTERMLQVFGNTEECGAYLAGNNAVPPIAIRMNTLKNGCEEAFAAAGLTVRDETGAFCIPAMTEEAGHLLKDGWGYVQDAASALAVTAGGPEPGMTVADVCAAPGGKSFTCAMMMKNDGVIHSFDISSKKTELMRRQAEKLGCTCMRTAAADSRLPLPLDERSADLVIADVPCSGFGVIRKKPEIRFKTQESIAGLPAIGTAILENVSRYVKPGGILLFTTCTVLPEENENVADRFLTGHPEFSVEAFQIGQKRIQGGMVTLYPHRDGTDGFFICRMRRTG